MKGYTVRYAICLGGFVTFVYNIPTTKVAEIHPNTTNQNSVRNQNKPIRSVSNQTKQNSVIPLKLQKLLKNRVVIRKEKA